jgi:hypothetical protein
LFGRVAGGFARAADLAIQGIELRRGGRHGTAGGPLETPLSELLSNYLPRLAGDETRVRLDRHQESAAMIDKFWSAVPQFTVQVAAPELPC